MLFLLKKILNLWCAGKCLSIIYKKDFPIFVVTFALYDWIGPDYISISILSCVICIFRIQYVNLWL